MKRTRPPMRLTRIAPLLLLMLAGVAEAREPEGTLGLIQTPNNGMPAVLLPGQSFDAVLCARADLKLVSDKEYPLTVEYSDLPGGRGERLLHNGFRRAAGNLCLGGLRQ